MTVESDSSAARSRILALAALAIATVCFSVVPIAVRFSETGPIATAFWRFSFSILPLLAWAQISVRRVNQRHENQRRVAPRSAHWTLFWVSVALAFDMILWHAAIANTSVVNSMLIAYSNPIFVALGAWFFLNERFGTQFLIGLVLAMLGSFLLISHGSAAFRIGRLPRHYVCRTVRRLCRGPEVVAAAFFNFEGDYVEHGDPGSAVAHGRDRLRRNYLAPEYVGLGPAVGVRDRRTRRGARVVHLRICPAFRRFQRGCDPGHAGAGHDIGLDLAGRVDDRATTALWPGGPGGNLFCPPAAALSVEPRRPLR